MMVFLYRLHRSSILSWHSLLTARPSINTQRDRVVHLCSIPFRLSNCLEWYCFSVYDNIPQFWVISHSRYNVDVSGGRSSNSPRIGACTWQNTYPEGSNAAILLVVLAIAMFSLLIKCTVHIHFFGIWAAECTHRKWTAVMLLKVLNS